MPATPSESTAPSEPAAASSPPPAPGSGSPPAQLDTRYRDIVSSAVDYAIITCRDDGLISSWNPGAERLTGWREVDVIGRPIDLLFSPEDVSAGVPGEELATAAREGRAFNERWQIRRDGTRFWASGEILPLRDVQGVAEGFLTILRDRTEQRRRTMDIKFLASASDALAVLADVPATLNKVAQLAVPDFADYCAIDLLEPDGSLRQVAAVQVAPRQRTQVMALHERQSPHPALRNGIWQAVSSGKPQLVPRVTPELLERAAQSRQHSETLKALGVRSYMAVPLAHRGDSLGVITFAITASPRTYGDTDLALAVDLGRRAAIALQNARMMRALRDADRAKDLFLATLAHELRNPLAPIRNGLSILQHVPSEPARVEEVTAMMERQAALLARLVDDLLDVSRIATGKLEIKQEPVNLAEVLSTAVEMSRPHIEAAEHELNQTISSEPAWVLGDAGRLAQVFSNLLNNAAKYTRRGGCIDLVLLVHPRELVVHVRDNGDGIEPPMLRKVFHRYTQLPQHEDRRQGGLGIGLSLVEGLVRLHKGRVEALSAGLGRGSEFVVRLPRYAMTQGPRQATQSATVLNLHGQGVNGPPDTRSPPPEAGVHGRPASGLRRRVLVVDDNADSAATVADLLAMAGCEAVTAQDGASVSERVRAFQPEVVLLDIGLPDISGYEVARQIRAMEGVRQPVLIALTGWGQAQDRQMAAEAGFDQHWIKPVDPQRLMDLASSLDALDSTGHT